MLKNVISSRLLASVVRISRKIKRLAGQRGAVLPLVAILIVVLLGFAAFAVDLGYLHVVKGELQNAADAGALAGAGVLFDSSGNLQDFSSVVEQTATATAALNKSGGEAVQQASNVTNPAFTVTAEEGHYSFTSSSFTPNNSGIQLPGWAARSFSNLDTNPDFINAVRVTVSRNDVPAFFSRIFGFSSLSVTNVQAVAYVGFTATLPPGTVKEPIAICQQSIQNASSGLDCGDARMINSGQGQGGVTSNTAAWTDLSQPCSGAASSSSVQKYICGGATSPTIVLGGYMGTNGGQVQSVFGANGQSGIYSCWQSFESGLNCADGSPCPPTGPCSDGSTCSNTPRPWPLTLPVIDCPGNNVNSCSEAVGAVDVSVIWIVLKGDFGSPNGNQAPDYPTQMADWSCPTGSGGACYGLGSCSSNSQTSQCLGNCCWNQFAQHFNLKDVNDGAVTIPPYTPKDLQKTIFFLPSCTAHKPTGTTGGKNFGILARYPVLVK